MRHLRVLAGWRYTSQELPSDAFTLRRTHAWGDPGRTVRTQVTEVKTEVKNSKCVLSGKFRVAERRFLSFKRAFLLTLPASGSSDQSCTCRADAA